MKMKISGILLFLKLIGCCCHENLAWAWPLAGRMVVPSSLDWDAERAGERDELELPLLHHQSSRSFHYPWSGNGILSHLAPLEEVDIVNPISHRNRSPDHQLAESVGLTVSPEVIAQLEVFTHYSAMAYCERPVLEAFSCPAPGSSSPLLSASLDPSSSLTCKHSLLHGTRDLFAFNDSTLTEGLQAFIAVNDVLRTIIISFRGTASFVNMRADLQYQKIPLDPYISGIPEGALGHQGFLAAYQEVKSVLGAQLLDRVMRNPDYTLTLTGHSMGGVLAVLAALDLISPGTGLLHRMKTAADLHIFTFGEPRFGNQAFVDYIQSRRFGSLYRAVNGSDPVPNLPPAYLGYKHHNREVFIGLQGSIRFCHDEVEEDMDGCSQQAFKMARQSVLWNFFTHTEYHRYYFGMRIGICPI